MEEREEEQPDWIAWWMEEKGVREPSGESEARIMRGSNSEADETLDDSGRDTISRANMMVNLRVFPTNQCLFV